MTTYAAGSLAFAGPLPKGAIPHTLAYTVAPLPVLPVYAFAALPAGAPVTKGFQFERSAVPAGHVPTLTAPGGAPFVPQIDNQRTWDDGSLMGGAVSFGLPAALAAGTTTDFQWGIQAGSFNNAPGITPAQAAAAADITMTIYVLASNTDTVGVEYGVDLGAILQAGPAWSSSTGYGTNPAQGYRVVRSGPLCVDYQVWGYLKAASGGAIHTQLKAGAYIRYWLSGTTVQAAEVRPYIRNANSYGALSGATVGPAVPTQYIVYANITNGATGIGAMGGVNDPRYRAALPASAFSGGTLADPVFMTQQPDYNGAAYPEYIYGVPVMFSGSGTPSGIPQNTIVYSQAGGSFTALGLPDAGNYAGIAYGTIPASGTSTMTPFVVVLPGCTEWLSGPDNNRIWVPLASAAARPSYQVADDPDYLARHARILPSYDAALAYAAGNTATVQPDPRAFPIHHPNGNADASDAYGDNPDVERIGYLGPIAASLLLCPFDPWRAGYVKRYALDWTDFSITWDDERFGQPTFKAGKAYAGGLIGNPTFSTYPSNYGSPAFMGSFKGQDKYPNQYSDLLDASHQPGLALLPWLLTGDYEYVEIGLYQALCTLNSLAPGAGEYTVNGTACHNVLYGGSSGGVGQTRGDGWGTRILLHTEATLADADPYAAFISDTLDQSALYAGAAADPASGFQDRRWLHLGVISDSVATSGIRSIYMLSYRAVGMSTAVKRAQITGTRPGLIDYLNVNYLGCVDAWDETKGHGRSGYNINWYDPPICPGGGTSGNYTPDQGTYYDSGDLMLAATGGAAPGVGFGYLAIPSAGCSQGNGNTSGDTDCSLMSTVCMTGVAAYVQMGEPNAPAVYAGLLARSKEPSLGWQAGRAFVGTNYHRSGPFSYPQFALAPTPPAG